MWFCCILCRMDKLGVCVLPFCHSIRPVSLRFCPHETLPRYTNKPKNHGRSFNDAPLLRVIDLSFDIAHGARRSTPVTPTLHFMAAADAVLSTRGSTFSILNFKTLFVVVFVRLVLTALQVVLSFHQLRNAASSSGLYMGILALSVVKIFMSHKVSVCAFCGERAREKLPSVWAWGQG